MSSRAIEISIAEIEDAREILALQKIAYQSEAAIYQDFTIEPLHQTLEKLLAEFNNHKIFKVMFNCKIVGSVRGYTNGNTCQIGKLIVDPEHQNQGIGTALLNKIEQAYPNVMRYELFTGTRSKKYLYLYHKLGYKIFKTLKITQKVTLVFMEKFNN